MVENIISNVTEICIFNYNSLVPWQINNYFWCHEDESFSIQTMKLQMYE